MKKMTLVEIKAHLENIATTAQALQATGTNLNASYRLYQTNTIAFLKEAVNTFGSLSKAEDFASLRSSFSIITIDKEAVSASNIKTIWAFAEVLNLSDTDRQKALLAKMLIIVNREGVTIGHLNNFANSFTAIQSDKPKLVHAEYDYIATDDNIITSTVEKKESLLLPKVEVGGLYFTDDQMVEVEKDAKVKITFGRELKKFGGILQGVLKGFDGKVINGEAFKAYLVDNIDGAIEAYEVKKSDTKKLTSKEKDAKIKELEAKLAEKVEVEQAPKKKIVA